MLYFYNKSTGTWISLEIQNKICEVFCMLTDLNEGLKIKKKIIALAKKGYKT